MTSYVKIKIFEYEDTQITGQDLWVAFKADFGSFTEEHFAKCSPAFTHKLRMHLRAHGVWVQKDNRVKAARSLYSTAQERDPASWMDNQPTPITVLTVPMFSPAPIPSLKVEQTPKITGQTPRITGQSDRKLKDPSCAPGTHSASIFPYSHPNFKGRDDCDKSTIKR
jgi:hypothetical protein